VADERGGQGRPTGSRFWARSKGSGMFVNVTAQNDLRSFAKNFSCHRISLSVRRCIQYPIALAPRSAVNCNDNIGESRPPSSSPTPTTGIEIFRVNIRQRIVRQSIHDRDYLRRCRLPRICLVLCDDYGDLCENRSASPSAAPRRASVRIPPELVRVSKGSSNSSESSESFFFSRYYFT